MEIKYSKTHIFCKKILKLQMADPIITKKVVKTGWFSSKEVEDKSYHVVIQYIDMNGEPAKFTWTATDEGTADQAFDDISKQISDQMPSHAELMDKAVDKIILGDDDANNN